MQDINISSMSLNGVSIDIDMSEYNVMMEEVQDAVAEAIRLAFRDVLYEVRAETEGYVNSSIEPQAHRVARSLKSRVGDARVSGNNVEVYAKFGSAANPSNPSVVPAGRVSFDKIGFGIHTSPDDNKQTYPIAEALQEGRDPAYIRFTGENPTPFRKGAGAENIGRQIGRYKSKTAWVGASFYFYGYTELDYLGYGMEVFNARIERRAKAYLDKRLGGI